MNTDAMREALEGSQAGRLTFGQVLGILSKAGIESYRVDLMRGEDTFYLPNGDTHVEKMKPAPVNSTIAANFSQPGVVAAIRAAQADQIRYPEFLKLAMAAGTAAYQVFLTGKKVIYFGRQGEFHVEEFPRPKV
jgi:uncharacterized protein YbcV (DUF1398 family)